MLVFDANHYSSASYAQIRRMSGLTARRHLTKYGHIEATPFTAAGFWLAALAVSSRARPRRFNKVGVRAAVAFRIELHRLKYCSVGIPRNVG
jgi:hypothetical protein